MSDTLEPADFRRMTVTMRERSHVRATAMARGCGMKKSEWLLACINAGLRANPALKGKVA